jgi:hypothetical protein
VIFIPDHEFDPIPDPDPEIKKASDLRSRICNTAPDKQNAPYVFLAIFP